TFVGVNVGCFAADYCMIRLGQCSQAKAIGGSTVKYDEDFNVRPEMLFEFANRRLSVPILTVTDGVAIICFGNVFQYLRVNSCIIVAGKAAGGFHVRTM